ncbi:MAG: LCP family protein [Spirochaetia bacterium]
MKSGKKFDRGLIILGFIIIITAAMAVFLFLQLKTDEVTEKAENGEILRVLLTVGDGTVPLTSQVFLYHTVTGNSFLLDVPGNIGSIIEKHNRIDRISILYEEGTINSYVSRIENILGIRIDYYIDIDFDNIEPITDLLGGMEIFIPEPVYNVEGDSPTLLPSGNVLLDGRKMLTFLSFQGAAGLEEMTADRRQDFIKTMLVKWGEQSDYLTKQGVFKILWELLDTNIDKQAFTSFLNLLGNNDIQPDRQRVMGNQRIVDNTVLLFPHFEGKLLRQQMDQRLSVLENDYTENGGSVPVTLEILNGTTVNGIARRTKDIYESFQGFNVMAFGNADSQDYEHTVVIDRTGVKEKAERAAEIIGCKRIETRIDEVSESSAHVTIILGKDFNGQFVKE